MKRSASHTQTFLFLINLSVNDYSESASSARDKVFARLPWDPVLISGLGLCVYVNEHVGELSKIRTSASHARPKSLPTLATLERDDCARYTRSVQNGV